MRKALGDSLSAVMLERAKAPLPWEEATQSAERPLIDPAVVLGYTDDALPLADPTPPSSRSSGGAAATMADEAGEFQRRLEANAKLLAAIGIDDAALAEKVLPALPQLARLEPAVVEETLEWLRQLMGDHAEVRDAVLEEPLLVSYEVAAHLEPGMQFLVHMSGGGEAAARIMAVKSPQMLRWAVDGGINERARAALSSEARFASAKAMAAGLRAAADVSSIRREFER